MTTAPRSKAHAIARALVAARVAACVNVVPGVASVYRWKGRIERAREAMLVIKTTARSARACRTALARLHPYDVPEILVVRVDEASPAYARWVGESTEKRATQLVTS